MKPETAWTTSLPGIACSLLLLATEPPTAQTTQQTLPMTQPQQNKDTGQHKLSHRLRGLFVSTRIKPDEQVIFFPSLAHQSRDGRYWLIDIHGWIFENTYLSEHGTRLLEKKVPGLRHLAQEIRLHRQRFQRRAKWFFVDNQRYKRLSILLQGKTYALEKSSANGHFHGRIKIPLTETADWPLHAGQRIEFRAVTTPGDKRRFSGWIHFIGPEGISVISDIDDTIKHSQVHDKTKLLRNTFLLPYQAVPGMADSYRRWARQPNTAFHYLTASPWQLYRPLHDFLQQHGFPAGSMQMKYFRIKDRSVINLLKKSVHYKTAHILSLIKRYPRRRFILVGDSGEQDLAIYSSIAKRFPGSIKAIYIRDTGHYAIKPPPRRRLANHRVNGTPVIVFDTHDKPARL